MDVKKFLCKLQKVKFSKEIRKIKVIFYSNLCFSSPTISTDEVTRDYTYGETNLLVKQCRLLPWIPADLEEVNIVTAEPPDSYYEVKQNKFFWT